MGGNGASESGIAWRQSLSAGLLLGVALGCAWLVRWSPLWAMRLLLAALAGVLAVLGVSLMVSRPGRRSWLAAARQALETRMAGAGVPFFCALAILLLAAISSGNNLLYLVASGLLAALAVSGVASALNLSGMELSFRLPPEMYARQPVAVDFTLTNAKSLWPAYSLTLSAGSRGGERLGEVGMQPVYLAYLPRRRSVAGASAMEFPGRGRYAPAAFTLATRFPFGLMLKRRRFRGGQPGSDLLVYPAPAEPAGEAAAARWPQGWWAPARRGEGEDLHRIRPHQPGDGAREVHWKATARVGALQVREFQEENRRQVRLRLALSPGLGPEEAEAAVSLCAGWLLRLLRADAGGRGSGALWLEFAGEHPAPAAAHLTAGLYLPAGPAAGQRRAILEYLALVEVGSAPAPPAHGYDATVPEILVCDGGAAFSNRSASAV